jgi:hypothetical protein
MSVIFRNQLSKTLAWRNTLYFLSPSIWQLQVSARLRTSLQCLLHLNIHCYRGFQFQDIFRHLFLPICIINASCLPELLGFWTLSIVLNFRKKKNVSETGSVSVYGEGRETPNLLGPLLVQRLGLALSKGPNRVGVSIPSHEDENIQFSKRRVF